MWSILDPYLMSGARAEEEWTESGGKDANPKMKTAGILQMAESITKLTKIFVQCSFKIM
jgi:hypothetical protein